MTVLKTISIALPCILAGCTMFQSAPYVVPNYDDMVGQKFELVIPHNVFYTVRDEQPGTRSVQLGRPDGCVTIFTVRKQDSVITAWKILPSPEACKVTSRPHNV